MIKVRPRPQVRAKPLTRRSDLPFAALDAVLLLMIEQHEGKPCPTRKIIREWTGMPRRRIWVYLAGMQARGLIEIEACSNTKPGDPVRRRMRIVGRPWTDWTWRGEGNPNIRELAKMRMEKAR